MTMESPGNFLYNLADRLGIDQVALSLSDWLNQHARRRKPDNFWIVPGVEEILAEFGNTVSLIHCQCPQPPGDRGFSGSVPANLPIPGSCHQPDLPAHQAFS